MFCDIANVFEADTRMKESTDAGRVPSPLNGENSGRDKVSFRFCGAVLPDGQRATRPTIAGRRTCCAFLLTRWLCVLAMISPGIVTNTFAHDPGLSTVTLQVRPGTIDTTLVFSWKDAAALSGLNLAHEMAPSALGAAARDALEIQCDGQALHAEIIGYRFDGGSNATVQLRAHVKTFSALKLRSRCFALLPSGHRQFTAIQNARGEVLAEKLLSASSDSLVLELNGAEGGTPPAARQYPLIDFLLLGVKHILTGYDHLLFLFSLLLVTRSIAPALKIITAFTVAHSITLAMAALNLVRVPASVVEPIIAASIVYVGIENLVRGQMPKGRALLTFAFGLIHGLGFASALREAGLGAGQSGIIGPLVSFNLGVELGQVLVAAIALPLLWKVSIHPRLARRWIPACSVLVALAGGCWLVQRLWFT